MSHLWISLVGVLQGFEQRASAAEHHDVACSVSMRGHAGRLLLHDLNRELDVHGGLEPGADHFALTLTRMAVAEEEQRAGLADR